MISEPILETYGKHERSLLPSSSIERGLNFVNEIGLNVSFEIRGNTIQTYCCILIDDKGRKSLGWGKGIGLQSKASALFEAIEHFIHEFEDVTDLLQFQVLDLLGTDYALREGSPDFKKICGDTNVGFNRIAFQKLGHGHNSLLYPYFLTQPSYKSKHENEANSLTNFGLMRYCSNSGTAAGLSTIDATLHALLEIIERDAIGCILLQTVIRVKPKRIKRIIIESLPINLQQISNEATTEVNGELELWDITSDLDIPTTLAAISIKEPVEGRYFGSGASISQSYSIERAILEAVQSIHAHTFSEVSPRPSIGKKDFTKLPNYVRCFLEKGYFGFRGGEELVEYSNLNNTTEIENQLLPYQQIEYILKKMDDLKLEVFQRTILDSSIKVSQVICPKLERFFLVSHGVMVSPSPRGKKLLT